MALHGDNINVGPMFVCDRTSTC